MVVDVILGAMTIAAGKGIRDALIYKKNSGDIFVVTKTLPSEMIKRTVLKMLKKEVPEVKQTIGQFPNIRGLVNAFIAENKKDFFKVEASKLLNKLDEGQTYYMESQGLTKRNLSILQKMGIIDKFKEETKEKTKEETNKKRNYIMEKIMLGNLKEVFKDVIKGNIKSLLKKDPVYNMSFRKIDKNLTIEQIYATIKNKENYKLIKDKDGNIVDIKLDVARNLKSKGVKIVNGVKKIGSKMKQVSMSIGHKTKAITNKTKNKVLDSSLNKSNLAYETWGNCLGKQVIANNSMSATAISINAQNSPEIAKMPKLKEGKPYVIIPKDRLKEDEGRSL